VTEQDTPQGATPRPIPDLGFFAGAAKPRGSSSFGSAPAKATSSSPAPSRFSTPSVNQFGSPPPAPQFGGPPAAAPFDGPPPAPPFGPPGQVNAPGGFPQQPYAYGPPKRRGLPVWAIVAIAVPIAFIGIGILAAIAIPVFLNARSTPVAPAQLGGLSMSTDPQMNGAVTAISNELAKDGPGVKREIAGYGTLSGGYVLMAFNARLDTDKEFRDLGASGAWQNFGDVQCATSGDGHTNVCLHTSLRGAVEVAAFGPVDLTTLARVTDEAWAAQPFGK
jgi:hypothetical protein